MKIDEKQLIERIEKEELYNIQDMEEFKCYGKVKVFPVRIIDGIAKAGYDVNEDYLNYAIYNVSKLLNQGWELCR